MSKILEKAQFSWGYPEGGDPVYTGYHDPEGKKRNGFAVPYFPTDQIVKMVQDTRELPEGNVRVEIEDFPALLGDTQVVLHDSNYPEDDPETVPGIICNTEDGPRTLYPVGAMAWTWGVVQEERSNYSMEVR